MPLSYLGRPLFLLLVLYILLLAGLKRAGRFEPSWPKEWVPSLYRDVCVAGRVASGFHPSRGGEWRWFEADGLGPPGQAPRAARPVLLRVESSEALSEVLRAGRRSELCGRLRPPRWPRNPGDFDEGAFLAGRGAVGVLRAREARPGPASWSSMPWALADGAHRSLRRYARGHLPPERAQVLEGILTGYIGSLQGGLKRAIQDAGLIHLLVPSGAKVATIAVFVHLLSAWAGLSPLWRRLASAVSGAFYVFLVGLEPPYLRAYLGALSAYAGFALGRDSGAFQACVLSAWLILLIQPRDLFSVGFQMTYAASLALLIGAPRSWKLRGRRFLARRLLRALGASALVQAALWPLFACVFGRGSLAGIWTNLIWIPLSPFLMASGLLAWGVHAVGAGFPCSVVDYLASIFTGTFIFFCRAVARLPMAAVDLSPLDAPAVAAFYAVLLAALLWPRRRASAALVGLGLLLGLAFGTGKGRPRLIFLSQPGRSAALLETASGRFWLFDAGARFSILREAVRALGGRGLEGTWLGSFGRGRWEGLAKAEPRFMGTLFMPPGRPPEALARTLAARPWSSRGGASVEAGGEGACRWRRLGESGTEIACGAWRARLEPWGTWIDGGAGDEYCIISSPTGPEIEACARARMLSTDKTGAVWVLSHGHWTQLQTQKRRALDRAFP